ncbi:MAG: DUF2092 domain-containing protein, partial [Chloroflexi bacterium]|nr:DUF2092 domain-containing protein [Chloroflexota bacterium]
MKSQWSCCGLLRAPWSALALIALSTAPAYAADEKGAPSAGPQQAAIAAPAMTESQKEAASLLKGMTEYLAGLKSFSVAFRSGYDVVQPSGQKIEFGESRRVSLARPDRLRVEEIASDGKRDLAVFDGAIISVLDAGSNVFAQVPQPGSLDEALVYFVRQLRMRMPLALLLTTRLPEALPGRVKTLDLVESTEILGIPAHHIAGRTDNVDFQFWIRDGKQPLPLRVVITYKESPGQPQYWANFADWNT